MDEEGAGVTHVDAVADMAVGQVSDLAVKLDPGRYVLVFSNKKYVISSGYVDDLYFKKGKEWIKLE